ncbi:uroporphyrinogen-III synthase [Sphingomonas sp. RB3P16]|uniref:uroporphyrinogen-III synthase n=1 Tax=Parasphingomonas frigoris TaxID=3096163 RepID=UPI002FC6DB28
MTRTLAVLRPEPGNAATCARAAAAGFATLSLPLFAVQAMPWAVPDLAAYDALLLTSANALRFGGPALAGLQTLPVLAVGAHTAAAARAAGFDVMASGSGDSADIVALAAAQGVRHALHLTGRDRTLEVGGIVASIVAVYESAEIALASDAARQLTGTTALLHSARAARRLGALLANAGIDRSAVALAAFSPAIMAAAGSGWRAIATATAPDDDALFAAVRTLPVTTGD